MERGTVGSNKSYNASRPLRDDMVGYYAFFPGFRVHALLSDRPL